MRRGSEGQVWLSCAPGVVQTWGVCAWMWAVVVGQDGRSLPTPLVSLSSLSVSNNVSASCSSLNLADTKTRAFLQTS